MVSFPHIKHIILRIYTCEDINKLTIVQADVSCFENRIDYQAKGSKARMTLQKGSTQGKASQSKYKHTCGI